MRNPGSQQQQIHEWLVSETPLFWETARDWPLYWTISYEQETLTAYNGHPLRVTVSNARLTATLKENKPC